MRMDRFTCKAQEALSEAQKIAERYNHQQIDTGHILLALIKQREGIVPQLLKRRTIRTSSTMLKTALKSYRRKRINISCEARYY